MEEYSRKGERYGVSEEEKKLELRLGPPDGEWSMNMSKGRENSVVCFPYFSNNGGLGSEKKKKALVSPPANTAVVPNTSQKRSAPASAPVVGWPPLGSFRKNLQKPISQSQQNAFPNNISSEKPMETSNQKGLFVKINMDGVPIGRKVDLKAYDSYDKLSFAVDELFKGLLAAQNEGKEEGEKAISGLLDGSGEYTLVYEDNEGDRMLVGDVPWHMFVSAVKRLRVLKSSELSTLCCGKQVKL